MRDLKRNIILVYNKRDAILDRTRNRAHKYLQYARNKGSGVIINEVSSNQDLIFFSSLFYEENKLSLELRLIERDGTILNRWYVKYSEIFTTPTANPEQPEDDYDVFILGALVLPDGSVVFNIFGQGLVKLDRSSNLVWKYPGGTHHSVELAEGGGFWVCGYNWKDQEGSIQAHPEQKQYLEDLILKISDDGELLRKISIPQLFYHSELEGLFTSMWPKAIPDGYIEISHLNTIKELPIGIADKFPLFEPGDIGVSLRQRNMIFVMNPQTLEIKWWKQGPWIHQHEVEFMPNGKIRVFNNNFYDKFLRGKNKEEALEFPRISNIIEIDPVTNAHKVIYGGRKGEEMFSDINGRIQQTENGGTLVIEARNGRIFEIDSTNNIIWSYINRFDDDEILTISDARVYPKNYFTVVEWQ